MEKTVNSAEVVEPVTAPAVQEPEPASQFPVPSQHSMPPEHEATLLKAIVKTTFVPVAALVGLLVTHTEVRGSAKPQGDDGEDA